MKLTFDAAGAHTTVQDLGRPHLRHAGVPLGGAADHLSLRIANLLAGNPPQSAALECAFTGPVVRFSKNAVVALFGARVDGLPHGRPFLASRHQVLDLRPISAGNYVYLAVSGGIQTSPILGSRATDTRIPWASLHGRPLRTHDVLPLAFTHPAAVSPGWHVPLRALFTEGPTVRFTRGLQFDQFPTFSSDISFRISSRIDRMGVTLTGPSLPRNTPLELRSSTVVPGTIQVPPDGSPIILLADAQTLGGYPVLGHVISVDLPKVAQLRPGAPLQLREVSLEEAHAAVHRQSRALGMLALALCDKRGCA